MHQWRDDSPNELRVHPANRPSRAAAKHGFFKSAKEKRLSTADDCP
jgi:hypothetical protein